MNRRALATLAVFTVALLLAGAFMVSVWDECRAEGHSIAYCIALTGR